MNLRPYQAAAVQAMRVCFSEGVLRQILYSPTGSGKTEIGIAVIRGAIAKGKRVVFLCNRIHLVTQTVSRLWKSGVRCGVIQGDNTRNTDSQVIVASIQTVARRGMPDCDLMVIDEAHGVAGSKDFRSVIEQRNRVPVIGLTATPFSKGLGKHYDSLRGALFQRVVIAATIPELIGDGYLVDCDIYAPSAPDMAGIKQSRNAFGEMDWSDKEVGRAVDKPQLVGDIVTHWLRLADGAPTVCFAANIAHSKHITEEFRANGIAAEHIDCYTKEDDRLAILARVASGETTVISNVGILCEGWDFPACKVLVLARPTKSLIRYIQMAGRVLRPHDGKDRALILDHSGTVIRLGFPTDELPIDLDDGTKKDVGDAEQQEKKPSVCPACKAVKIPGDIMCHACGFIPERTHEVVTVDGELAKVSRKKHKLEDKQRVYSELLAIRNARGYSDGWVAHKYRAYFGVWPKGLSQSSCEPSQEIRDFVVSQNIRFARAKEARNAA